MLVIDLSHDLTSLSFIEWIKHKGLCHWAAAASACCSNCAAACCAFSIEGTADPLQPRTLCSGVVSYRFVLIGPDSTTHMGCKPVS